MIIFVRDINGNTRNSKEVAATLAGFATYMGYETLTLQLENSSDDNDGTIEDIVYRETSENINGGGSYLTFSESGIDALMSEAMLNKISKNDFYDNVNAYTKNHRFDVAQVSKKINFMDILKDRTGDLLTIFSSSYDVYDFVFVTLDANHLEDVFGEFVEDIEKNVNLTIWTLRQGETAKVKHKVRENEIYIITDYDTRSAFTEKVMAKNIGTKKQVTGLNKPIGYRDSIDQHRLGTYIRKNSRAAIDEGNDANLWATQLKYIIDNLMNKKKKEVEDIWDLTQISPIKFCEIPDVTNVHGHNCQEDKA